MKKEQEELLNLLKNEEVFTAEQLLENLLRTDKKETIEFLDHTIQTQKIPTLISLSNILTQAFINAYSFQNFEEFKKQGLSLVEKLLYKNNSEIQNILINTLEYWACLDLHGPQNFVAEFVNKILSTNILISETLREQAKEIYNTYGYEMSIKEALIIVEEESSNSDLFDYQHDSRITKQSEVKKLNVAKQVVKDLINKLNDGRCMLCFNNLE